MISYSEELKKLSKADFDKHNCSIDFDIFANTNLKGDKTKVKVKFMFKFGPAQSQLVFLLQPVKVVKVKYLVWNCNWHPLHPEKKRVVMGNGLFNFSLNNL